MGRLQETVIMDANTDIDFNDVALLVRVVQKRSFSAAARERGVPVSTVSRRVARLEAALGTRLLERTTRALRLTDAGRTFFDHASRAMDDLAQGSGLLRERQAEPRGRVRILAPTWFADCVANVLFGYLARFPRVSIDLEFDQRCVDPTTGGFDIAIVAGKLAETADFVARDIWRASPKRLFASPGYLQAHGTPRRVGDLAEHDLIAIRSVEGFSGWTLMQGRTRRRLTFAPRLYTSEISAARSAAVAGLGIALLPDILCRDDLANKQLVQVLESWEGERGGVHLLYRARRSLTVAVRTCIDHLLADLPGTDPARGPLTRGASQSGTRLVSKLGVC
jgi:DNA-binding transcriptional LysR family regulator